MKKTLGPSAKGSTLSPDICVPSGASQSDVTVDDFDEYWTCLNTVTSSRPASCESNNFETATGCDSTCQAVSKAHWLRDAECNAWNSTECNFQQAPCNVAIGAATSSSPGIGGAAPAAGAEATGLQQQENSATRGEGGTGGGGKRHVGAIIGGVIGGLAALAALLIGLLLLKRRRERKGRACSGSSASSTFRESTAAGQAGSTQLQAVPAKGGSLSQHSPQPQPPLPATAGWQGWQGSLHAQSQPDAPLSPHGQWQVNALSDPHGSAPRQGQDSTQNASVWGPPTMDSHSSGRHAIGSDSRSTPSRSGAYGSSVSPSVLSGRPGSEQGPLEARKPSDLRSLGSLALAPAQHVKVTYSSGNNTCDITTASTVSSVAPGLVSDNLSPAQILNAQLDFIEQTRRGMLTRAIQCVSSLQRLRLANASSCC